MLFRFLTGLGLGAEWGIAQALINETWPPAYRGRAAAFVHSGWPVGYGIAAAIFAIVGATWGWRGMFLLGILPALVTVWIRRSVKESPLFVEMQARRTEAKMHLAKGTAGEAEKQITSFPLLYIFSKAHIHITAPLLVFILGSYISYWGVMTWVPTMLLKERGLSIATTGIFIVILNVGGFIGANVFGWISDRFGRKKTYAPYLLISAVTLYFYGNVTTSGALLVLGGLFGFLLFGCNAGQGAFYGEMFPTFARATALNFLTNIGRLVSAFSPYYVGYIAPRAGLGATLALFSVLFILMAVMLLFLPERKGVKLE